MVTSKNIDSVVHLLRQEAPHWNAPVYTEMKPFGGDPYCVLIACLLSLRTQDTTTGPAARRLFALASTPRALVELPRETIEKAIYPVLYYRNKARIVQEVSQDLLDRFDGQVPKEIEELVSIKGVGRKTANLVRVLGHGRPGICVDTHVHRITNRWGYVHTKTPDETEQVLRKKLPKPFWMDFNDLLVATGQIICRPISPKCSQCPVEAYCAQREVIQKR